MRLAIIDAADLADWLSSALLLPEPEPVELHVNPRVYELRCGDLRFDIEPDRAERR